MTETKEVKQIKGATIKTVVISVLVILLFILLLSNTLDEKTKQNFWYFIFIISVVVGIVYFMRKNKKKIDIYKIAKAIKQVEFKNTNINVSINDVEIDYLDAEHLLVAWESKGILLTYKYHIAGDYIVARLSKKIDTVKDELDKREVFKQLSVEGIRRKAIRKIEEDKGFEYKEIGEDE